MCIVSFYKSGLLALESCMCCEGVLFFFFFFIFLFFYFVFCFVFVFVFFFLFVFLFCFCFCFLFFSFHFLFFFLLLFFVLFCFCFCFCFVLSFSCTHMRRAVAGSGKPTFLLILFPVCVLVEKTMDGLPVNLLLIFTYKYLHTQVPLPSGV